MHLKGVEAEQYIKEAKQSLAELLKVQEKELFFTSGGTESNNLALIGCAMAGARRGKHLITTRVEHPSVSKTMKYLEEQGFRISYLPVDAQGIVSLEALEAEISRDTILVSTMFVNNEVGAVMPVEQIAQIIRRKKPDILYHVDGVQAFGKFRIYPKKMGIDLLSVSAHKIHGPKGAGLLYVNEKARIRPILFGGDQQRGLRSGTENVPGIAGLAKAAELCYTDFDEKIERLYALREYFVENVSQLPKVQVNGPFGRAGAPHIVSVSFYGVRSEVLLHGLEDRGIYASAGSACSSHKRGASPTLSAMGLPGNLLDSTLRFSFSEETTREELDYCIQVLSELLPVYRRYTRR
jgi:cysteine desulfurase